MARPRPDHEAQAKALLSGIDEIVADIVTDLDFGFCSQGAVEVAEKRTIFGKDRRIWIKLEVSNCDDTP